MLTHQLMPVNVLDIILSHTSSIVALPTKLETLRVLPPSLDPCSGDGTGDGAQQRRRREPAAAYGAIGPRGPRRRTGVPGWHTAAVSGHGVKVAAVWRDG